MMDEESEYETEALQKANCLLVEKEKEIEELEAKLELYRKKFPDESMLENMVDTNFEMKKLEKQVYFFLNIHQSWDNWLNSEKDEKESLENCEKLDNNILMQETVCSPKLNSDDMGDDSSSKEPPICKQNGELGYNGHNPPALYRNNDLSSTGSLVSDFIGRLQVLEADLSFLKHSINLLSNGEEGLKLLQEIADQLQQLRQIGIRELDQLFA
ncbi:Myosin-binding protein 1 [Glycine max]|nr:Myosin-binding protein 1 [Glycine max]